MQLLRNCESRRTKTRDRLSSQRHLIASFTPWSHSVTINTIQRSAIVIETVNIYIQQLTIFYDDPGSSIDARPLTHCRSYWNMAGIRRRSTINGFIVRITHPFAATALPEIIIHLCIPY